MQIIILSATNVDLVSFNPMFVYQLSIGTNKLFQNLAAQNNQTFISTQSLRSGLQESALVSEIPQHDFTLFYLLEQLTKSSPNSRAEKLGPTF